MYPAESHTVSGNFSIAPVHVSNYGISSRPQHYPNNIFAISPRFLVPMTALSADHNCREKPWKRCKKAITSDTAKEAGLRLIDVVLLDYLSSSTVYSLSTFNAHVDSNPFYN